MRLSAKSAAILTLLAITMGLSACSSSGKSKDKFAYVEEPVETLYLSALDRLERKRYEEAIVYFGEVERQHPYSAWARRAMLMTAFSQYQQNDYEEALENIQRFIDIHPGNKDAPYAYYLRAMCHYERIRDVGRDQDITLNALNALTDVVNRYPDTEYARDARLKLDLTHDHLAGKEMDVGRWYLKRNQHVGAINRFDTVVKQYQTTSHVPEALHRLVESYLELGLYDEAKRHAAILGYNYKGSRWYGDTYALFEKRNVKPLLASEAKQVAEQIDAPRPLSPVDGSATAPTPSVIGDAIAPPSDLPTDLPIEDVARAPERVVDAVKDISGETASQPVIETNPDDWEK